MSVRYTITVDFVVGVLMECQIQPIAVVVRGNVSALHNNSGLRTGCLNGVSNTAYRCGGSWKCHNNSGLGSKYLDRVSNTDYSCGGSSKC